ncbi:hypothetical protein JRQ81_011444 [Phrynocephalus forsythii]|uniref:Cation channel sperm-associated protein subunit gamma n=1 Tax=Phrynocephalus forsythii TaxID=171643 RepID=A0A9Q0X5V7_9SAUR|nr:hypothetical protein JRQ81_011444 [Phrynocephalus forsythii]
MWQPLAASVFLVVLLCAEGSLSECKWFPVLNSFDNLGGDQDIFYEQHVVHKVREVFKELTDSAIDPNDRDARSQLPFSSQDAKASIRTGHYSGMTPVVTVTFQEPVHSVRQKQEQLQIEMRAAPFRIMEDCDSEEVCKMCWYTPMPFMNGSAVMDVMISSSNLGLPVQHKRFSINMNGYVRSFENKIVFRIGSQLVALNKFLNLTDPSRPLWSTHLRVPVLILGNIPQNKIVLISDMDFENCYPVEKGFSSSIVDTIATESTLFIRQNQLVYYFTGHYPVLHMNTSGSEFWTRVLNSVCVKRLNPVFFPKNDSEFVIALGGGWQEGEFFLITVKDGIVTASGALRSKRKNVCDFMRFSKCSIVWAAFSTVDNKFYLLVSEEGTNDHFIVAYYREEEYFEQIYDIPQFVPKASDKGFVMLLGMEQYTNTTLVPRGLALNPYDDIFYIWGNVILQSNDMKNYIYLSNFPGKPPIKYFVLSFSGAIAFVTDTDEVWVAKESSTEVKKVYPSKAWSVYNTLQVMNGVDGYDLTRKHAIITIFFDRDGMQELVYREDPGTNGRIIKRRFPLDEVLTYDQLISTPHKEIMHNGLNYIRFTHHCPFAIIRMVQLPQPQRFTRMEHYRVRPPEIMEKTGFHDSKSLMVYQGLVYQLLQLHSAYHRSYADPVHDPTWRWWKNKKQDAEYYYYVASNWKSSGGIYVDMANYAKIYNLMPNNLLPHMIYLDKKTEYTFSVYLSIRNTKQSMGETAEENSLHYMWLTAILAHPEYIHVSLQRHELISRGSVLYLVTIADTGIYPIQQLSGKNLLKSSATLKVAHSGMNCYGYTAHRPEIKGTVVVGINIGCPPGKRLAFDITYTKNYTEEKNKRYFDCVVPDPEMPCFYFSDVFYPFFLIQDMVTGDSGRFNGSYIFTIIGGGPYSVDNIQYYTKEEVQLYNTWNGSDAAIWLRADGEEDMVNLEGFQVLSQANPGILWVCQTNSPCYDIVPISMSAPEYYFVVKVSNRGVDQTTYCDYALEFIVHIHGLRLSTSRSLYLLKKKKVRIIDIAIPGDSRVTEKQLEKNLKIGLQRLWHKLVQMVPVVIDTLGAVPKELGK